MSDLYVAEMYAPLLGVASDPEAYIRRVMDAAAATLSKLRWMDFLYALEPIKDISTPIKIAFQTLITHFDHTYPMPRIEVFASIVKTSLLSARSLSVRNRCLEHIGISREYLAQRVLPCVTRSIAEWVIVDPFLRGFDLSWQLQELAENWGDQDGSFMASLHQSFLTAIARKTYLESTPWSMLPEGVHAALCTRVLGIPACDIALYGLTGSRISKFWGLFFEITDPRAFPLSPTVASRIRALPWPVQAVLQRIIANVYADPERALCGEPVTALQEVSAADVEFLCLRAHDSDQYPFAIPAMIALLKWQVTRACEATWGGNEAGEKPESSDAASCTAVCPEFTALAWCVFSHCTLLERLPFVATLFGYRAILAKCGHEWTYETVISADIVAFLCDPFTRLTRPSREIIDVLLHYLPSCRTRLPEYVIARDAWELAFVKRFNIPLADVKRATSSD